MQIGILEFVLAYSDRYDSAEKIAIPPDADDNKFLECAVQRVRGLSSREIKNFSRSGGMAASACFRRRTFCRIKRGRDPQF